MSRTLPLGLFRNHYAPSERLAFLQEDLKREIAFFEGLPVLLPTNLGSHVVIVRAVVSAYNHLPAYVAPIYKAVVKGYDKTALVLTDDLLAVDGVRIPLPPARNAL